MRCRSCNLRLESFDNFDYCKRCIKASEDTNSVYNISAPKRLQSIRNAGSVTSSIGAKKSGLSGKFMFDIFIKTKPEF